MKYIMDEFEAEIGEISSLPEPPVPPHIALFGWAITNGTDPRDLRWGDPRIPQRTPREIPISGSVACQIEDLGGKRGEGRNGETPHSA